MWSARSTQWQIAVLAVLVSVAVIVYSSSPLADLDGGSLSGDYARSLNQFVNGKPEWGPVAYVSGGLDASRMVGVRAVPIDLTKDVDISRYSHIAVHGDGLPPKLASAIANRRPVYDLDGTLFLFETKPVVENINEDECDSGRSDVRIVLPPLGEAIGLEKPSVSGMLHMVLLSRSSCDPSAAPISGSEAFRLLTNEALAKAAFGRSPFVKTRNGIRYRLLGPTVGDGLDIGESHRDQCLGVFSGMGYSLDTPIILDSGGFSFRDLLAESIANFSFEQDELSWTAHAYATYVAPKRDWTDRFGKTTTFSELLKHLMSRRFEERSCAGLHLLHALVAVVNADYRHGILETNTRVSAHDFLMQVRSCVIANQRVDGSWDPDWWQSSASKTKWDVRSQLIVTGHMLEILAELEPPLDQSIVDRSNAWMVETLSALDFQDTPVSFCPLTHALRSVLFWNAAQQIEWRDLTVN